MARNGDLRFMIYPDLRVTGFAFKNSSDFQKECQRIGNCFKTRKEADSMVKKIRKLLKDN